MSQTLATPAATAELRAAAPDDLEAIERLLSAANLPVADVADALDRFIVAEADGEIVGVIGIQTCCPHLGLLRSTAVAPEWRTRGIGRRLVEHAIAMAEARGFNALYLLTTTADRYLPSVGFVEMPRDRVPDAVRSAREFRETPSDAAVMALELQHR